jgi:phosphoribosylformylglycinamidine synthase PurS subunit
MNNIAPVRAGLWRAAHASGPYNTCLMQARVFVSLKRTVLDPQGQTVRSALAGLGYSKVADVRQGKFFDIALDKGITREQAQQELDAIARDVLTNPVIEDYRIELVD